MQCTGVSWNSTGTILAAAFGRHDVYGWCNETGLLCLWRVASKLSKTKVQEKDDHVEGGADKIADNRKKEGKTYDEESGKQTPASTAERIMETVGPDLVMETSTYLMSVAFHPELPSLVAGGSFGGELLVWNINLLESDSSGGSAEECMSSQLATDTMCKTYLHRFRPPRPTSILDSIRLLS